MSLNRRGRCLSFFLYSIWVCALRRWTLCTHPKKGSTSHASVSVIFLYSCFKVHELIANLLLACVIVFMGLFHLKHSLQPKTELYVNWASCSHVHWVPVEVWKIVSYSVTVTLLLQEHWWSHPQGCWHISSGLYICSCIKVQNHVRVYFHLYLCTENHFQ